MNIQLMKHGRTLLLSPITNIFRMQNKWKLLSMSNIVLMYPLPYPIHVISSESSQVSHKHQTKASYTVKADGFNMVVLYK